MKNILFILTIFIFISCYSKKPIKVIVYAGQSNCGGRGLRSELPYKYTLPNCNVCFVEYYENLI
jgi:hypothetical protein